MSTPRRSFSFGFERFSGLYLWAAIIIVFGTWKSSLFLTKGTLHSVASGQAITGMLALAVLIPLAGGAYDLSVGANINLATIVAVVLQTNKGWGMWPSIVAAIAASTVVGLVNAFVVVKLRVNSFIATLGMASIVGAAQSIESGQQQPLPPTSKAWLSLTQRTVGGFQIVVLYLLVLAVVIWWVLQRTPAGRYLYALGGNSEAARLAGVRTDRLTFLSLVASGLICGIAGVFYASLSGPSLTFGPAMLLPAFAAVFLGSTQLQPGRFNVWGSLIAVYVLATGVKGLQLVTGVQWLSDLFNGVALIVAVAFAAWRQRSSPGLGGLSRLRAPRTGRPTDHDSDGLVEVSSQPVSVHDAGVA